jgi:hypothetical protein
MVTRVRLAYQTNHVPAARIDGEQVRTEITKQKTWEYQHSGPRNSDSRTACGRGWPSRPIDRQGPTPPRATQPQVPRGADSRNASSRSLAASQTCGGPQDLFHFTRFEKRGFYFQEIFPARINIAHFALASSKKKK